MIHGIPAVVWINAATREEAVMEVLSILGDDVVSNLPNDIPSGDKWYLKWVRGTPPEPLADSLSYDLVTDTIITEEE